LLVHFYSSKLQESQKLSTALLTPSFPKGIT
jgi:hypothetical protein